MEGGLTLGALEGFMATWAKARTTFGEGTPQDGAVFDNSPQLRQMQSNVESAKPGSQWTGAGADTYDAANQRQGRVLGDAAVLDQKLRAEVDRSAAVVAAGRRDLDAVRHWVVSAASTVPQTPQGERMLYPIVGKGAGEIAEILQKSNGDLNAIAGRMRGLGSEYQALAGGFKEDEGGDKEVAAKLEEERKRNAQRDVDLALKGDKDAQQRVRDVLNTIGPAQVGGTPKLNPEQASYLSQMQAQQKLRNVDQLKEAADKGASDIMADSWQLMSNPKLEVPKTESRDGALEGNTTVKGGFDQLPDGVTSTLESPGIEQSANLQKIADITSTGHENFQKDTDFDRGMIHKVADMMESPQWRNGDPAFHNPLDLQMPWEPDPPPPHADLERAASAAMDAVSHDHQVVHDAITGKVEPGNEFGQQVKIDHEHFLYNLTHEEWDDDGAAAGSLFDWTNSAATGPEKGIAASTAHAYGEYIGHNSKDLMHLSGSNVIGLDGVHTLGDVNPHLTYAVAEGLTPYINNIAGLSGGLPGFEALDEYPLFADYTMPDTKGLFAVLNSDQGTAALWNSEVYKQALLHETAFAQHPSNFGADAHLNASAMLRALVDDGAVGAFDAFAENQNQIATTEREWKEFGYDAALGTLVAGGGELPGAGPIAGEAIDRVGGALKDEILGTTEPIDPKNPISNMSAETASSRILTTVALVGGDIPLPQAHYDANHNLIYPPGAQAVMVDGEIVCPPGVPFDKHSEAIVKAAGDVLGPASGGYSAIEGMISRFNGVTETPNPNG
ncbi:MAG: hypothetical protein QOH20_3891 [Mycobacterium sp.]|nr:hypothetical protein [Mycobacterium sp.]